MIFFIKRKNDNDFDSEISENQLGEISLNKFWPQLGYDKLLMHIERGNNKYLENIEIFNDKLEYYSIEEFLDKIKPLYIAKSVL